MNFDIVCVSIGTSRQTRLHSVNNELAIADGVQMLRERLSTLTWRLHHDLLAEIFDDKTKRVIEYCRIVCDVKSLLSRINKNDLFSLG